MLAVVMSLHHTSLQGRTRRACVRPLDPCALALGLLLVHSAPGVSRTADLGGQLDYSPTWHRMTLEQLLPESCTFTLCSPSRMFGMDRSLGIFFPKNLQYVLRDTAKFIAAAAGTPPDPEFGHPWLGSQQEMRQGPVLRRRCV